MKCDGLLTDNSKKRRCNFNIDNRAIYCPNCGKATDVLRGPLSARSHLAEIPRYLTGIKSINVLISVIGAFLTFLIAYFVEKPKVDTTDKPSL